MRQIAGIVTFAGALAAAVAVSAQREPVLHCFAAETQIGVVARREFLDDRGFVVKEILYRSTELTARRTCAEDTLRVYSVRTFTRDALGRSVVETEMSPAGAVERVVRHEYLGDSMQPSRDIWASPQGERRYEIRRPDRGRQTHLYYDQRGMVVGVTGPLPTDVRYAVRWGTETGGWSCGIAVDNGSVYIHLKNGSTNEVAANFVEWFTTDLRNAKGLPVPLLPAYVEKRAATPKQPGVARLVAPGDAAFYTHSLESRYGRLPPGHYALALWHPHPVSGVMLLSNTYEFDVPAER